MKKLALFLGACCVMGVLFLSAAETADKIPLRIEPAPAEVKAYPVDTGIPFPRGALKDAKMVRVLDAGGKEVPSQARELAKWEDGKGVKAVLVSFQADISKDKEVKYALEYGKATAAAPAKPVTVKGAGTGTITVNTGALSFKVKEKSFGLTDFTAGGKIVPSIDLVLKAKGKEYRASATKKAKAVVEDSGPMVACVRLSGTHASGGEDYFDYIVRVYAYAGKPYVRVWYTILNTDDKTGPEDVDGWGMVLKTPGASKYAIGGEKEVHAGGLSGDVHLSQKGLYRSSHRHNFSYEGVGKGAKAPGWIDVSKGSSGVTAKVRHFWQQFPKAIAAKPGELTLWLHSPEPFNKEKFGTDAYGEPRALGYASGIAKTHEILLYFHKGDHAAAKSGDLAEVFEQRPFPKAPPKWYCKSGAFGYISSTALLEKPDTGYANVLDFVYDHVKLDGIGRYWRGNSSWHIFGNTDFGEVMQQLSMNLPNETPRSLLLQFISRDRYGPVFPNKGKRNNEFTDEQGEEAAKDNKSTMWMIDMAENQVHHHMDIDVSHCNKAKGRLAGHGPGMHWKGRRLGNPPPEGVDKIKGWERVWKSSSGGWKPVHHCGASPETHCSRGSWAGHPGGIYEYYLLTGERRPLEVLKEQAGYGIALYDKGFKEKKQEAQHAWLLWTAVRAYKATGDKKYLANAERIMKFQIDWWNEPEEWWSRGKKIGMVDHPRGYWTITDANDSHNFRRLSWPTPPELKSTGATRNGSHVMFMAVIEFHDMNKTVKTKIDNKQVETMLVECMRFISPRGFPIINSEVFKNFRPRTNPNIQMGGCDSPRSAITFPLLYISQFANGKEQQDWHAMLKSYAGLPPFSGDKFKVPGRKYSHVKGLTRNVKVMCNPNEQGPIWFFWSVPNYVALYEKLKKEGKEPK